MRARALATDYDGTLASEGVVRPQTWAALERWRAAGGRAVLVTGRVLPDLQRVCGRLERFDAVVAENGALLHLPWSNDQLLAEPPPPALLWRLKELGIAPLGHGRVIVATLARHAAAAEQVLRELGLRWRVVLNRESAMLLPQEVTKASGLQAALATLGLSLQETAAIGDAENDEAMLAACAFPAAVANAVPSLRARARLVTRGAEGEGVAELIAHLLVK